MEEFTLTTKKGKIALPCMTPVIVPINKVQANDYNPNHVSTKNMKLLERSIVDNGFCFPIVTIYDEQADKYVIVDGFHRYLIFRDYLQAENIPVVVLKHSIAKRMAATIQFNRARGVHQIEEMGDLIIALINQGVPEDKITKELGMDLEEVLRLKQVTGVAEAFKNQAYSAAWEFIPDD